MTTEQKLSQMGLKLPECPAAVGVYRPAARTGNFVYTSGQLPIENGQLLITGKVPEDVTVELAQQAARHAALNALAAAHTVVDSLDDITQVVRLTVFVNSSPGFTDQSRVANGASEFFVGLLGEAGKGTRCAVGVGELPTDAPVEVDVIFEVR